MEMKSKAKKDALKKMKEKFKSKRMEEMMPDMENMKKVTVMSDTEEGLEEGLSKAQKIMEMKEKMMGDEDEYADGGCSSKKKKY